MKYVYLLCFCFFNLQLAAQLEADSIFMMLDEVMKNSEKFDSEKEERLNGLKSLLTYQESESNPSEIFNINNKIIQEYWSYSFDSTITYINHNKELAIQQNNQDWTDKGKLDMALLFASSGRYKESEDILESIDKSRLSDHLQIKYFNCYEKIYSDLDYFSIDLEYKDQCAKKYKAYSDSIVPLVSHSENEALYRQEWELLDQQRFNECLKINSLRLSKAKIATEEFSYITFQRSMIYEQMADRKMESKFLALSAISDIKASRKDNAALAKLALRSYEKDDITKAYEYIKYSFGDAIFYNSKHRFVEIANSFSLIMEAHQLESDKKNRALRIFTVIVSVLSLVLFSLFYHVYRQKDSLLKTKQALFEINKQYKEVNTSLESTMDELKHSYHDLAEANMVKELYIGNFMKIHSSFIDKLDNYRLHVNKMLRAKKYQELHDNTITMNAIEDEINTFYLTFDKTFLSLFPNFVEELNQLLLEEEQIKLKNDEILNTELRILAVIRLGIKDSSRIAQLLRYSVNTIYNYRAKIKSKAKNRKDFEAQILRIGAYDIKE